MIFDLEQASTPGSFACDIAIVGEGAVGLTMAEELAATGQHVLVLEAGGASLFRTLCGNATATCAGERVGNVGRNTLRADGIQNIDVGFIKNTRFGARNLQFRVEMFNATNTRNFGIPEGRVSSTNFLNQWGTDGGKRSIWVSARFTF